jgi:hypothetical protein
MTFSIFNPCTGNADDIDMAARTQGQVDDEATRAREARIAEVRALIEEIAEVVPAGSGAGLR